MSNQKISAMTAASALTGAELVAGVQSGANVAVAASQIRTLITSSANTFNSAQVFSNAAVSMTALPIADPHVVGRLWANAGVLTVSAG